MLSSKWLFYNITYSIEHYCIFSAHLFVLIGYLQLHILQEEILYLKRKKDKYDELKTQGYTEFHANLNEYCCRRAWSPSTVVPAQSETLIH